MVEDIDTEPVDEQVAPVMPPLVLPPLEELEEEDDDEDELLDDDELLDEEELLEDDELVVEPAYEHHVDVLPAYGLDGKLLALHATPSVCTAYTKLPDLPNATERVPLKEHWAPVFCAHFV